MSEEALGVGVRLRVRRAPRVRPAPFGWALNWSILVPFPVESCLSGVVPQATKAITQAEAPKSMRYRLTFTTSPEFSAAAAAAGWRTIFSTVPSPRQWGGGAKSLRRQSHTVQRSLWQRARGGARQSGRVLRILVGSPYNRVRMSRALSWTVT